jgi:hypothetical protein
LVPLPDEDDAAIALAPARGGYEELRPEPRTHLEAQLPGQRRLGRFPAPRAASAAAAGVLAARSLDPPVEAAQEGAALRRGIRGPVGPAAAAAQGKLFRGKEIAHPVPDGGRFFFFAAAEAPTSPYPSSSSSVKVADERHPRGTQGDRPPGSGQGPRSPAARARVPAPVVPSFLSSSSSSWSGAPPAAGEGGVGGGAGQDEAGAMDKRLLCGGAEGKAGARRGRPRLLVAPLESARSGSCWNGEGPPPPAAARKSWGFCGGKRRGLPRLFARGGEEACLRKISRGVPRRLTALSRRELRPSAPTAPFSEALFRRARGAPRAGRRLGPPRLLAGGEEREPPAVHDDDAAAAAAVAGRGAPPRPYCYSHQLGGGNAKDETAHSYC